VCFTNSHFAVTIKKLNAMRWFQFSAIAVLIVTALLKLVSLQTGARFFLLKDPVFPFITNGQMMALSAILELCVAIILIRNLGRLFQFTALMSLTSIFLLYRLGLAWIAPNEPCKCYGRATDWLHISSETGDTAMKIILAYLLIGSYATLFWIWRENKTTLVSTQN
jgi:hypothetical protein